MPRTIGPRLSELSAEANRRRAFQRLAVFAEERTFFRYTCGLSERDAAKVMGLSWETYTRYIARHPPLEPVQDPEWKMRQEETKWTKLAEHLRRPHGRHHRVS